MGSRTVSVPGKALPNSIPCVPDDGIDEFVDTPEDPRSAMRGAITGIVLGAGLWGIILVLAGVIKI